MIPFWPLLEKAHFQNFLYSNDNDSNNIIIFISHKSRVKNERFKSPITNHFPRIDSNHKQTHSGKNHITTNSSSTKTKFLSFYTSNTLKIIAHSYHNHSSIFFLHSRKNTFAYIKNTRKKRENRRVEYIFIVSILHISPYTRKYLQRKCVFQRTEHTLAPINKRLTLMAKIPDATL